MKATVLACIAGLLLMGNSYAQQDFDINTLVGDYVVTEYYYHVKVDKEGNETGEKEEFISEEVGQISIQEGKIIFNITEGVVLFTPQKVIKDNDRIIFSDFKGLTKTTYEPHDGVKYPLLDCNYYNLSSEELVICLKSFAIPPFGDSRWVRVKYVMKKK